MNENANRGPMFRYSNTIDLANESSDFVRRKRHGNTAVLSIFYVLLLAMLISYLLGSGYATQDRMLVLVVSITVIALISHALYSIQRNLDLIMAVEFQNALFTSAINARAEFTLIIRRDGSAAYADRGFRRLFPAIRNVDDRVIDYLIGMLELNDTARERMFESLAVGKHEQLLASMTVDDGPMPIVLAITPLRRPQGYFMLQGRHYIEFRNEIAGIIPTHNDL